MNNIPTRNESRRSAIPPTENEYANKGTRVCHKLQETSPTEQKGSGKVRLLKKAVSIFNVLVSFITSPHKTQILMSYSTFIRVTAELTEHREINARRT